VKANHSPQKESEECSSSFKTYTWQPLYPAIVPTPPLLTKPQVFFPFLYRLHRPLLKVHALQARVRVQVAPQLCQDLTHFPWSWTHSLGSTIPVLMVLFLMGQSLFESRLSTSSSVATAKAIVARRRGRQRPKTCILIWNDTPAEILMFYKEPSANLHPLIVWPPCG